MNLGPREERQERPGSPMINRYVGGNRRHRKPTDSESPKLASVLRHTSLFIYTSSSYEEHLPCAWLTFQVPGRRITVPVLMDQMHLGWTPPAISNKSQSEQIHR